MQKEKYTPIKDRQTKEPIFLGDLVKSEKDLCGTLVWDDYFNRYIIKTEFGGNIYARTYTKIKELKKNNIDTTGVECRKQPNKKLW
tara:strand:+ start:157 stop:414 length:258 start_codon:yes stop_codon:yes gene_type:complete